MYSFCTLFDRHYLPRALALYHSLRRHCPTAKLFALCMDFESYEHIIDGAYPGLIPIALVDFERADERLLKAKGDRSGVEYYFTCTGALPAFIFRQFSDVDLLTLVDADTYLFSDPGPVFEELKEYSVGITAHRYARLSWRWLRFGRFNVGWVTIRRDTQGLACAAWWSDRCIEWCYDRVEDTRFADQKYLNEWPSRFDRVRVIRHKGVNLGPWNVGAYRIVAREGQVWIDEDPLIHYHFAGLKQIRPWLYDTSLGRYLTSLSRSIRRSIYYPYISELSRLSSQQDVRLRIRNPDGSLGSILRVARRFLFLALGIGFRQYVVIRHNEL